MNGQRDVVRTRPGIVIFFMPFGIVEYPHLGTGLLKACLELEGFRCDVIHCSLDFARRIGRDLYSYLEGSASPALIGERMFARALGDRIPDLEAYFNDILKPAWRGVDNSFVFNRNVFQDRLKTFAWVEEEAVRWIEEIAHMTDWSRYQVFGFSTSYEQNVASLALAKRLRERYPNRPIVFGGANCMAEMGEGLLRNFGFIDFVATGESEKTLVKLLQWLDEPERHPFPDKGLIARRQLAAGGLAVQPDPVTDLNTLPIPDYDDYFSAVRREEGWQRHVFALAMEGSRGCWKAKTEQCVFCGLNGAHNFYRAKSGDRFVDELRYLCERYDAQYVMATDNILCPSLLATAIPKLAQNRPYAAMWQEVRVGLSRDQLEKLRRAGIRYVGAGIESLSTDVLRLMRKGRTALENVQFLRMATELGIDVTWHIICGLPGEAPWHYEGMAELMSKLHHLCPPKQMVRISIDRNSPLYLDADTYGLDLEPSRAYRYLYDLSGDRIAEFAYCFQNRREFGEHMSTMGPPLYTRPAQIALDAWIKESSRARLGFVDDGERLTLFDQRDGRDETKVYDGSFRDVILWLMEPCSAGDLVHRVGLGLSGVGGAVAMQSLLCELSAAGIVVEDEGKYLFIGIDYALREKCMEECTDNFFLKAVQSRRPYSFNG